MSNGTIFDTNAFFSGGAGMFLQYHDIVKPVYLYAVLKMIITQQSFGLPISIIESMSNLSIIEWYVKRRFKNPLMCLDYNHQLSQQEMDNFLLSILNSDDSIYSTSPPLNIERMLQVYRKQQMSFPIYVYSEQPENYIEADCRIIFSGIKFTYLHGDLKEALSKCDQNYTYIFSDIELVKNAADILTGTCSHILLAREYRYNYIDNCKTLKYDLKDIADNHQYLRLGTTLAIDLNRLALSIKRLNHHEEEDDEYNVASYSVETN